MSTVNRINRRLVERSAGGLSDLLHGIIRLQPRPDAIRSTALPAVIIPTLLDGRPALAYRCHGTVCEVSAEEMTLALEHYAGQPRLLVSVEVEAEQPPRQAGLEVFTSSPMPDGRILVHGRFGGPAQELLLPKNLTPRCDFETMTFHYGFPAEVLRAWAELGVLQEAVIDRLRLCPRCHGLPLTRLCCRQCGAVRTVNYWSMRLLAQSAAAATRPRLVAGDDPSRSGAQAGGCEHSAAPSVAVSQCLRCEHRFADEEAFVLTLHGYHAQRFNPAELSAAH
ncbi:MAG: hypothetical protein JNM56_23570 [Planctomycetia bacterium]|nr:hypothetical protein [Planctomycetia bacterium]